MNETLKRHRFLMLGAAMAASVALGGIAVAQVAPTEPDTPFRLHPEQGPLDSGYGCEGPGTQIIGAGDVGWVEIALRSRGLVLIDYGARGGATVRIVTETPEQVVAVFEYEAETTRLSITHVDGTVVSNQRTVSAIGSSDSPHSTAATPAEPQPAGAADDTGPSPDGAAQRDPGDAASNRAPDRAEAAPWLYLHFDAATGQSA